MHHISFRETRPNVNIQPKELIKIVQSSKIKKYVEIALSIFQDKSSFTSENVVVVFSGKGPAINKTITIVEIIKRKLNGSLYQYTQIGRDLKQDEDKKDDDEMILDREDRKEHDKSRDKLPTPVITIYLCSSMIPHLEKTLGYQLPVTS
ncbi:ribonuclease P protein subunit p25-like protein isoform X2 [Rhizophagus clarus]|uniref:Ribonuclease P protein subunit p25-like protein isoform X2 n=1 Tax=Rhizophagus clarus TaxID=94130 RepID=A0A8H3MDH4_9GLOM|nr:ribonuclease P protein subunit p25-like protein isoform X2 [Rhizophagus clarus]